MSFADNLCKKFGLRLGPTKCLAWSGSKLFDTLVVFPNYFFCGEKVDFEKKIADKKNMKNYPLGKEYKIQNELFHVY